MKLVLSIFLFSLLQNSKAQKIIISGKEGNRPLVWSDFTGKADESSSYFALTYWNIKYNLSDVQFNGESVVIGKFEVVLELNSKNSWLKKGKASDALLEHEQGHFNTGILCMRELIRKVKDATFTKKNMNEKLQALFNDTLKKYHDMGERYDDESDHSMNLTQQAKWNNYFKEQLAL